MVAGANQQPRLDLLENADHEVRGRSVIHGDGDNSAICAAQKCRNPRRRVRAPDYDAIAFANSARGKFAGEPERHRCHVAVGPTYKAISDPLGIGPFFPKPLKVCQIIGDACPHKLSVNHLTFETSKGGKCALYCLKLHRSQSELTKGLILKALGKKVGI